MAPGPMPMAHRCSVRPQHSQHKRCWCPSRSHAPSQASERAPPALCIPLPSKDRQPPGEVGRGLPLCIPRETTWLPARVWPQGVGRGLCLPEKRKRLIPGFAVKAGQGRSLITSRDGRAVVFRWNF